MKKTDPYRRRLIVLLSFLAAVLVFFGMVMFHYQIVNGDSYRAKSVAGTAKREIVETSRGIITDRNGKVLVSNRLSYTLKFSDSSFGGDQDACNSAAWRLIDLCQQEKIQWIDPLPLAADAPFALTTDTPGETFVNWLKNEDIPYTGGDSVTLSVSGDELMDTLRSIYSISDEFTDAQARLIAGVRYGVSMSDGYVFAEDVPVRVISQVVDGHYAGVSTGTSSQRVYNTTYASHILGRVNRIFAEDWDKYKDKGYSMDALVGKGGVEEAFEEYLHGTNGVKLVTTDKNGKVTGELYAKEPEPGNTVALTIDLDLQKAAEDSLAGMIQSMTNTKTEDVQATVEQILALEAAGCEIIRCAVPTLEAAQALKEIKKQIHIPLVADIHFDYTLAIAAMENGADKIRINPGNIGSQERIAAVLLLVSVFRRSQLSWTVTKQRKNTESRSVWASTVVLWKRSWWRNTMVSQQTVWWRVLWIKYESSKIWAMIIWSSVLNPRML